MVTSKVADATRERVSIPVENAAGEELGIIVLEATADGLPRVVRPKRHFSAQDTSSAVAMRAKLFADAGLPLPERLQGPPTCSCEECMGAIAPAPLGTDDLNDSKLRRAFPLEDYLKLGTEIRGLALLIGSQHPRGVQAEVAYVVRRGVRLAVVDAESLGAREAEEIAAGELELAWQHLSRTEQGTRAAAMFGRHRDLIDDDKTTEAKRRERERGRARRGLSARDPLVPHAALVDAIAAEVAPFEDLAPFWARVFLHVSELVFDGAVAESAGHLAETQGSLAGSAFVEPRTKGPGYAASLHANPTTASKREPAGRVISRALQRLGFQPAEIGRLIEIDSRTVARWLAE